MFALILIGFALAVGIPVFVAWLVIKYLFELRKRQNDEFLKELSAVIHTAVRDALKETENKND